MPLKLIVAAECHVDTALAHALVRGQRRIVEHIRGVPNVGSRLNRLAASQEQLLVIGLVDHDKDLFERPGIGPYRHQWLPQYTFAEQGFQVFTSADRPGHFWVVLEPACDKQLYLAAGQALLALGDAPDQMPAIWPAFLAVTKQRAADENPRLIGLLRQLLRQPSAPFAELLAFVEGKMSEAGLPNWQPLPCS